MTACQAINCDTAPRRKEGITYTYWMNDNNFVLFDLSRSHTTCVGLSLSCCPAQNFLKTDDGPLRGPLLGGLLLLALKGWQAGDDVGPGLLTLYHPAHGLNNIGLASAHLLS